MFQKEDEDKKPSNKKKKKGNKVDNTVEDKHEDILKNINILHYLMA